MTTQRELDLGAADLARETVARIDAAVAADPEPSCCARRCRDRGWKCQSEAPFEERMERIFTGPGAEG